MNTVSVVIPTRDRLERVSVALRCAAAQRGVQTEVIVVDDGSRVAVANALQSEIPANARVVRLDSSVGVASARNAGIREAQGEWIAFLDDDDLWSPDKLARQIGAAVGSDADAAVAAVIHLDEDLWPVSVAAPPTTDFLFEQLLVRNVMPAGASNVVARADVIASLGGFDAQLAHLADWDLWIRLAERCQWVAVAEPLVGYVHHDASMLSAADAGDIWREVAVIARSHAEARMRLGAPLDRDDVQNWIGNERRSRQRARLRRRLRSQLPPGRWERIPLIGLLAARYGQPSLPESAQWLHAHRATRNARASSSAN